MIRIIVIADVTLFRSALAAALAGNDEFAVIDELACDDVVAHGLVTSPDVAVVDFDAPRAGAFAAVRVINEQIPECRILGLSSKTSPDALRQALSSKVLGLVSTDCSPKRLVDAIRAVAAGERVIEPGTALAVLARPRNPLTARELEVLRLLAEGFTGVEIAATMHLAPGTVRNYLSMIIRKAGARNRIEAVRIAQEANWL